MEDQVIRERYELSMDRIRRFMEEHGIWRIEELEPCMRM